MPKSTCPCHRAGDPGNLPTWHRLHTKNSVGASYHVSASHWFKHCLEGRSISGGVCVHTSGSAAGNLACFLLFCSFQGLRIAVDCRKSQLPSPYHSSLTRFSFRRGSSGRRRCSVSSVLTDFGCVLPLLCWCTQELLILLLLFCFLLFYVF